MWYFLRHCVNKQRVAVPISPRFFLPNDPSDPIRMSDSTLNFSVFYRTSSTRPFFSLLSFTSEPTPFLCPKRDRKQPPTSTEIKIHFLLHGEKELSLPLQLVQCCVFIVLFSICLVLRDFLIFENNFFIVVLII